MSFEQQRIQMVASQIERRGVRHARVLAAMRSVPRHEFVEASYRDSAYDDTPLPIGHRQTISQPYIVAYMTELLQPQPGDRILEVGTGSGYQAAVLAEIGAEVYTIEIVEPLCARARADLQRLGYQNITVICGDGYNGWPAAAPYDGILVAAAPEKVPQPLLDQLKVGGRLVIPVGGFSQDLIVIERTESGYTRTNQIPVRFVPMTGQAEE
ncbi:MAG: protein-L-isoaspartate(D-aspartate) O-methyltransferase [Leptospiraceae bacterium]|nr:protein-L-isoaspartate(D-aspartate) O-methyltransferase [Leptospiraceae bacterium]